MKSEKQKSPDKNSRIYLAGHRGLVGSAVLRELQKRGYTNILTRTHVELDLTSQASVTKFFERERPEFVILAAAKVGGIGANSTFPAEFIYENLMIGANVIHAAWQTGVHKLINLGSSCIFPKMAPQPMSENAFLSGPLEVTNEAYAVAKIAAIRLCKHYNQQYGTNFLSAMPTNMYGPGDNYDLESSHVLPALIRKFHDAKVSGADSVELWGDGSPFREFLYSEDLARALVFLLEDVDAADIGEFINVGSGEEIRIRDLAELVNKVVYTDAAGRACNITWNTDKPNGTPRKLMDSRRLFAMGWMPQVGLEEGITLAYQAFLKGQA